MLIPSIYTVSNNTVFSIALWKTTTICLNYYFSFTFRSATIGVKSKNHAVLLALKRASSELSAYQKKIMILDDHIGMYNIQSCA